MMSYLLLFSLPVHLLDLVPDRLQLVLFNPQGQHKLPTDDVNVLVSLKKTSSHHPLPTFHSQHATFSVNNKFVVHIC